MGAQLESMRLEDLEKLIEKPEFHRRLHLDRYHKGYSFGIGRDPITPSKPALYLQVEGDEAPDVPNEIDVGGETIRIIIKTRFKVPSPYSAPR